jgi:hypothetical protein
MKDLNSVVADLISEQVEAALRPHMEMLARMSAFMGVPVKAEQGRAVGTRRAVRRASTVRGAVKARGSYRPGLKPAHGGKAVDFRVGEAVMYQQGKGVFQAKVVKVNEADNTVTVQAEGKKQRVRPAAKVYEVSA